MRAAILSAFNQPYDVTNSYALPSSLTGHDILVRVQAASYCHTDHVYASGAMSHLPLPPLIPCHEFAGVIEELGPKVSKSLGLAKGTRVGVPGRAFRPCGICAECRDGSKHGDPDGYGVYCARAGNLGLSVNGGMAEYALADSRQVAPLPEGMTAVQAAPLMCAGVTIWAALAKAAESRGKTGIKGSTVAIMGAGGGLGHLGVSFAAKMGFETVLAVDAADNPLKLLREVQNGLAADEAKRIRIVDARSEDADAVLEDVWPGIDEKRKGERGVDAVLILPESQRAYDYGVKLVRNHGTVVIVSFPKDGFKISANDIVFRDLRIVGSLVGRNWQLREMLQFAQQEGVRAKVQSWPLEKVNELVEEYLKGLGGKLVVDMDLDIR